MTTSKTANRHWASLLALTAMTVLIAQSSLSGAAFVISVLLITLVKGRIEIDHFMGLNGVAGPLRWIVLGWLVTVLGLVALAFPITGETP